MANRWIEFLKDHRKKGMSLEQLRAAYTEKFPAPAPTKKGARARCATTDDCLEGLICSDKFRCRAEKRKRKPRKPSVATGVKKGARGHCTTGADCLEGLICSNQGRCRVVKRSRKQHKPSVPGAKKGPRGKCASADDCQQGLVCSDRGRCRAPVRVRRRPTAPSRRSSDRSMPSLESHTPIVKTERQ